MGNLTHSLISRKDSRYLIVTWPREGVENVNSTIYQSFFGNCIDSFSTVFISMRERFQQLDINDKIL